MAEGFFPDRGRREFVLDGKDFDDLDGFYDAVSHLLTHELEWPPGHNLDAFNDLLRGGFGVHGYGEPITLEWHSFAKSRRELGDRTLLTLLTVILDADESGHDCLLRIYD